jgi:hypothetical protein
VRPTIVQKLSLSRELLSPAGKETAFCGPSRSIFESVISLLRLTRIHSIPAVIAPTYPLLWALLLLNPVQWYLGYAAGRCGREGSREHETAKTASAHSAAEACTKADFLSGESSKRRLFTRGGSPCFTALQREAGYICYKTYAHLRSQFSLMVHSPLCYVCGRSARQESREQGTVKTSSAHSAAEGCLKAGCST